jgi:hypothetical protein
LRRGRASAETIQLAESLLSEGRLDSSDTALLAYPLGRVFDALGDPARAFACWASANAARQDDAGKWRPDELESILGAQLSTGRPVHAARVCQQRLVFVVGMPRSGTTLVEQILDAHPDVAGCGELSYLSDLATRLPLSPEPGRETLEREALAYLDVAARSAASSARVWVDKAPLNAFHLGWVARLFPDASVVWCRRDARDVALSIFSENFSKTARFATDLSAIACYIEAQHQVMRHWQATLDLPILEVAYESLVSDIAAGSRRLIQFCGLEWDDRVSSFHSTGRIVQTPSRWQVRRPAYTDSIGRWRRYERWLSVLDSTFGRHADDDGVYRT